MLRSVLQRKKCSHFFFHQATEAARKKIQEEEEAAARKKRQEEEEAAARKKRQEQEEAAARKRQQEVGFKIKCVCFPMEIYF
jgi:hypothetical protein